MVITNTPTPSRTPLTPHTISRIQSVMAYIAARNRSERFNMAMWFREMDSSNPRRDDCGFSCCFAGFAAEMEGLAPSRVKGDEFKMKDGGDVQKWAQDYLGLSYLQASSLFMTSYWPYLFGARYRSAQTNPARFEVLKDRIAHFIQTGD